MIRSVQSDILKWLRDYRHIITRGYMPKYHAVLCDPPYGLSFMGRSWDDYNPREYQQWVTEWAELLLDYVYPGAVLMAFGGTRTYHRLVCGLEDAGWEIYDSIIAWTYGQGFPKNHDLSKAIDKQAGAKREVVGKKIYSDGKTRKRGLPANDGWYRPWMGEDNQKAELLTAPATSAAKQWAGYGTSFKPSFEPIVLARAPREGYTYVDCATQFGSGALHIDAGRIETRDNLNGGGYSENFKGSSFLKYGGKLEFEQPEGRWPANTLLVHHPACGDTCHADCHVRRLGEQTGELPGPWGRDAKYNPDKEGMFGLGGGYNSQNELRGQETGTAARYFYQAKAAPWERDVGLDNMPLSIGGGMQGTADQSLKTGSGNERNNLRRNPHPTVKPIQLLEYLARLLKPPIDNSRILIPFAGSGSEMIAAHLAGWDDIVGIEREAEYIAIARARLDWWTRFDSYAMAEHHHKHHADHQMTLFEALETTA